MNRLRLSGGKNPSANKRDRRQDASDEHLTDATARVTPFVGVTPDAPPTIEQGPPSGQDFGRLGDHVSSIVSAAEEAAVRIREEARQEAEQVREQAEKEAAARTEAARRDSDALKADAEQLRADAQKSLAEAREAGDTYVAEKGAEAEAKVREIVAAGVRRAAESNEAAERRHHALKTDLSSTEVRLRQLATGLHELAARLDTLLATPGGNGGVGGSSAGNDLSLLGALEPQPEPKKATRT
jgi:cell division septum initiation protein DivIVA